MKNANIETEFNQHFIDGYQKTGSIGSTYKNLNHERVVVIGVGGSSLGGRLLKTILSEENQDIDVFIHNNYGIPPTSVHKNALIIIVSYHGNTKEILDAYKEATSKKLPIVVLTSGGTIKRNATRDKLPMFLLPSGYKPRFSLVYQLGALIAILENSKMIPSQKKILNKLRVGDVDAIEKEADAILEYIGSETPIFYASPTYASLAYIMKIQMNENAKLHGFSNVFPESGHNEIMGYTNRLHSDKYKAIMIQSQDDDPRIISQQNIFTNILAQHNNPVHTVDITGETRYSTLLRGILLGHMLSFKVANKHGIDPYATDAIEEFKHHINKTRRTSKTFIDKTKTSKTKKVLKSTL